MMEPELIHEVPATADGASGWLVIDSTVGGRSHGGLRISMETGPEELRMLAQRMTLKFGFLGIANGGAKAGIRFHPEAPAEARREVLRRFSESVRSLVKAGRYQPHPDMGTTEQDIREAFGLRSARGQTSRQDSGYYTALGVLSGASVALRMRNREWRDLTVAVHGFGKVGSSFARLAAKQGARIVAVSTSHGALHDPNGLNVDGLLRASVRGSRFVLDSTIGRPMPAEDLLKLPVDLLSPCAGSGSIHDGNVADVKAAIICAGANCPMTADARRRLSDRGALCLPDYLTSSGGILGGTMAFAGIEAHAIRDLMARYLEPRFSRLFEKGWEAAEQDCLTRFREVKENAERGNFGSRVFRAGLQLYRAGIIPRMLVARLAPRYFLSR